MSKTTYWLGVDLGGTKMLAALFNGKFKLFAETVKKDAPLIKSLVAYDDLIREIDPKFAKLK